MKNILKRFADEEFGNAVIDWTVLLAGTFMLAIAVVMTISSGTETVTDTTSQRIAATPVGGQG
ncbi:hypothetical protein [Aliiroseovarius marinus]|uniref:hypothetical protein n=1 Tax=Aliiroseovarius marinus TaxID=2500159 RepID=UPI003D7C4EE0